MNGKIDPQDIFNQLSFTIPKPPTKMQVEEYVELLNKIIKAKPAIQEETLRLLKKYNEDLDKLSESLAVKLKELYQINNPLKKG